MFDALLVRAITVVLLAVITGGCDQGWPWASPPVATGDCSDAIISADVTGDGQHDDIVHAFADDGAVLRVCLHDGTIGEIDGMGQGEVLDIINIGEDGTREIVYGSTTASTLSVRVAVWARDRLARVAAEDGTSLELHLGGDGTFDEEAGWSVYRFWGCADMDGDGRIDLVSAEGVRARANIYTFDVTGYSIENGTARPIGMDSFEAAPPDPMAAEDPYRCPPPA